MSLLSRLVDFSLRNRPLVVVLTLLFFALGIDAALKLPIDAVPDVTTVQVQIITSSPALSPVEVEQYVSIPVERAMSGIPNVIETRSISKYGISVVTIVFTEDTNIYFARQLVSERMSEAEESVPREYGRPEMGPISSALGEVFQFVLKGDGVSLLELEETLDWYVAPQLRTVPGVVETLSFGGQDKQYQILIDPSRLQASGLSVREVAAALEASNANAGGGYVEHHREQIVLGTDGLVRSLEDLKSVVVGSTAGGVPITIENVGEVCFGPRLRRGAASMDNRGEVVVGVALMLLGENARVVTEAVKVKLAELGPSLPKGMAIEPFYDRSELVMRTIRTVLTNLAEGALLVVFVLLLLLGDLRAGLIVALMIPLAMCFAVIALRMLGLSGNLMSLGAIDFGLIVDGSVIIVEHSLRRLNEAYGRGEALTSNARLQIVKQATMEVRTASVFGELIIAVVYLPILTLRGTEGKLFVPMATTVLLALLGAFVASLTVVPVLCSWLLRPGEAKEPRIMRALARVYAPALSGAMKYRAATFAGGGLALAAGLVCFSTLGSEFIPQLDEGDMLVEARRLPGISLSESVATDARMQEALLAIPEIEHVVSKTGAPELAMDPMGVEQTDVYLKLKPRAQWRAGLDKQALAHDVETALEEAVPDVAISLSQPIQMRTNELVAGIRSDVAAQIYGPNLHKLSELGMQVADVLKAVEGAVDVRMEQGAGIQYLRIVPDRRKLARYGLRIADVNQMVETIAVGHHVGDVLEGDRRFEMVIKSKLADASSLAELRSLPLKSATGQAVPLGDVATLELGEGPALVNRDKLSRRLVVEFNVRGRDTVSVVNDAQRLVQRAVTLPSGYRIEWGGQFQNYAAAKARLMFVVPVALVLILLLLWLAFDAIAPALLIFVNIPFAAVGGAVALWVRDIPFSISAGVGFIALFGVAVLNGLVLVAFCRELEKSGASPADAIRAAALGRLRPVMMTAAVAALGFIPMALSSAAGSEVQRPLATVVIGGLVSASALTLLFFPTLYAFVMRQSHTRSALSAKEIR